MFYGSQTNKKKINSGINLIKSFDWVPAATSNPNTHDDFVLQEKT